MPEFSVPFRIEEEQGVGLVEVAGWTPAGLQAIFQRQGWPLPPHPGEAAQGDHLVIRLTPCIAWLVGGTVGALEEQDGCACDLSHSRLRLNLDGTQVTEVLAKVMAVDLDPRTWRVGAAAATSIHGVPALIHRLGAQRFAILVPRSFVRSIREWLLDSAQNLN
jgi:heterotetrameric sarcosine oxidase gamma subunit